MGIAYNTCTFVYLPRLRDDNTQTTKAFAHLATELPHDKQEVIFTLHLGVDSYFLRRVSLKVSIVSIIAVC